MPASLSTVTSRRLAAAEWLGVFQKEYLDAFLPQGGSCVRFLSGGPNSLSSIQRGLQASAASGGFRFLALDPSRLNDAGKRPDYHRPEKFFFAISRSIEWPTLAYRIAAELLTRRGIQVPAGTALGDYEGIAAHNGRAPENLLNEYKRWVNDQIIRDHKMARDFRTALAALSQSQLIGDDMSPTTEEALLGWLSGRQIHGSQATLKRVFIREKIGRSNAWFMLVSLCHWLKSVEERGQIVVMDFRPYERINQTTAQKTAAYNETLRSAISAGASQETLQKLAEKPEGEYVGAAYSQAAYLNALELLRHLIDGVEQLPGFALVVLATPDFFDDRPYPGKVRRFTDYNALQTRIGLEVHDCERQNPSASLVHLEAE